MEIKPDYAPGIEDVFSSAARSLIEGIRSLDILAYARAYLTPEMTFHVGVWICPDLFYRYQWPYTRTYQAALPGRPGHLFIEGTNPSQRSRAPEYRET